MTTLLDHALKYHEKGFAIVPIARGKKQPVNDEWQTRRLNPDELQYFFSNGYTVGGIGAISGLLSGNRVNLDFDGQNHKIALENFLHSWDHLRNAPIVKTGSGKTHVWVEIPDLPEDFTNKKFHREIVGQDDRGRPIYAQTIELRGNRSNNLLPPSLHPSGGHYEWMTDEAEWIKVPFQELYTWLVEWSDSEKEQPAAGWVLTDAKRSYGELPRRTLEFIAHGISVGERNEELYYAAQQYRASGRPLELAMKELLPAALKNGTPKKEAQATIQSGYNGAEKAGMEPIKAAKPQAPTHDELRDRFLAGRPLLAWGLGDWREYHEGLWSVVDDFSVKSGIVDTIEAAKPEGIRPTASMVNSITELAKIKVAQPDDIWDADPDYLVCRNGALYIPSRTLEAHKPGLYATSGVGYDYHPSKTALAWTAFLLDLAESTSPAVVSFLQEFAGYGLTVDTSHEIAVWLYGPPGSGKSTFLTGLEAMLGSRAGLLGLADIERNRFALADLPGKTLAIATEQPSDFIASTHLLNALISGETIIVDRKFRDAVQITARCKLAWAMNELPRVSDPNSGLFRRVKVVEFPVIPESRRNPKLKEDIKTEGAGILNWALEGLDRLRKRGRFEIPPEVIDATQNFKENNDIPARFVEERCVIGLDENQEPFRAQTSQLYNAYKEWCLSNGHKPQSSTGVANDWKRMGFEKKRPGGIVYWFNVGIKNV